ncbi:MAG: potassium/proton antiporter, partial [Balneolales bacterium]
MLEFEIYLFFGSLLLLISVFASKASDNYGIPALLIFLGIGIVIGSEVLDFIYFDDPEVAQTLGIIALIYILFSGGMDTNWRKIKRVLYMGIGLSTVGVLLSAFVVGLFAYLVLDLSILQGMLLGAIISSTDAAAVFSVLRSKSIGFKYNLKELIELESGTNDPMAIFLSIGLIGLLQNEGASVAGMIPDFFQQMVFGALIGLLLGKVFTWTTNHINLGYDGLYPVLMLAFAPFGYALTQFAGGNGFLAVYIIGLIMGNSSLIHQKSLMQFNDGVAWLMQISMFLALGLLVFPSAIIGVWLPGLILAGVLIFIARPISVYFTLFFTRLNFRAKTMVAWVGLRGAVPIILATFPLVAGLEDADTLFSIVFFVVITSIIIQGTTIPWIAKLLHVDTPVRKKNRYPIELEPSIDTKSVLKEIELNEDSSVLGKQIVELNLPDDVLIVLINRGGKFLVPRGATVLEAHDKIMILSDRDKMNFVRDII